MCGRQSNRFKCFKSDVNAGWESVSLFYCRKNCVHNYFDGRKVIDIALSVVGDLNEQISKLQRRYNELERIKTATMKVYYNFGDLVFKYETIKKRLHLVYTITKNKGVADGETLKLVCVYKLLIKLKKKQMDCLDKEVDNIDKEKKFNDDEMQRINRLAYTPIINTPIVHTSYDMTYGSGHSSSDISVTDISTETQMVTEVVNEVINQVINQINID